MQLENVPEGMTDRPVCGDAIRDLATSMKQASLPTDEVQRAKAAALGRESSTVGPQMYNGVFAKILSLVVIRPKQPTASS